MYNHIIALLMFCCISFGACAREFRMINEHQDRHLAIKNSALLRKLINCLDGSWPWCKVEGLIHTQTKNLHLIPII
jgi:hypothetical protein